ncbi:hypothetical protein GCM10022294_09030 [Dietzia aurantiaca]
MGVADTPERPAGGVISDSNSHLRDSGARAGKLADIRPVPDPDDRLQMLFAGPHRDPGGPDVVAEYYQTGKR